MKLVVFQRMQSLLNNEIQPNTPWREYGKYDVLEDQIGSKNHPYGYVALRVQQEKVYQYSCGTVGTYKVEYRWEEVN